MLVERLFDDAYAIRHRHGAGDIGFGEDQNHGYASVWASARSTEHPMKSLSVRTGDGARVSGGANMAGVYARPRRDN